MCSSRTCLLLSCASVFFLGHLGCGGNDDLPPPKDAGPPVLEFCVGAQQTPTSAACGIVEEEWGPFDVLLAPPSLDEDMQVWFTHTSCRCSEEKPALTGHLEVSTPDGTVLMERDGPMTEPLCYAPGSNDACTRATAESPFGVCSEKISVGSEVIVAFIALYPDGTVAADHEAELVFVCPQGGCLDGCADL